MSDYFLSATQITKLELHCLKVKKAVRQVKQYTEGKGCWVFDRGADNTILKDFFIGECSQAIIRMKKNTRLWYKQQEYQTSKLAN